MPRRNWRDPTYRPYDPKFHPQDLVERMSKGETNVEVAKAWNISEDSFYIWRGEHKELEEAYKKGLTFYEAWFKVNIIDKMINGKLEGKHSFAAAKLLAARKLNWYDSPAVQKTQINIAQMTQNQIQNQNVLELKESVLKDLEYLTDMKLFDVSSPKLIESQDESGNPTTD